MQTRPDASELLDEVRRIIRTELLPAADGKTGYTLRMMLNALSIAERQMLAAEQADELALIQLSALLDHDGDLAELERELARRVRAGDVDGDEALQAMLWALTLRQVRESAPRYLDQEGLD